ncbi:MAG TPA: hypothetical protein VID29_06375 [Solirubrobacteraceae bacterium]|jgi:hypothetical protein
MDADLEPTGAATQANESARTGARTAAGEHSAGAAGEHTAAAASAELENERLRARVAALEAELVEVQARANAAVGRWQERAYWLDRLHIDLNALMERPGANELRLALRAVRAVFWRAKRIKRRLLGQ